MPLDSNKWTAEERAELRWFIACRCWKKRDGSEASCAELEALTLRIEASGPPPREDPVTLEIVKAMGRAARSWVDELKERARRKEE